MKAAVTCRNGIIGTPLTGNASMAEGDEVRSSRSRMDCHRLRSNDFDKFGLVLCCRPNGHLHNGLATTHKLTQEKFMLFFQVKITLFLFHWKERRGTCHRQWGLLSVQLAWALE